MFPMMLMLAAAPPAAEAPAATVDAPAPNIETGCSLVLGLDGETQVTPLSPDVHVLGVGGPLHMNLPPGARLLGVMCHRLRVVPDAEDDRVIRQYDVPLYIAGNGVTVKLQLSNGGYVLRTLDGLVSSEDQASIDAVLDQFKSRLSRGA
jgi:hypothetical protein